jgi:hypothetical protein
MKIRIIYRYRYNECIFVLSLLNVTDFFFFFFAKLNVMDLMLFNEHRDIPIMAIFSRDCRL